jgi:hypothetical protein
MFLFWMRFEAGDLYPPYSSLRSDPLGARVLFDSLESIDGRVERNFRPLDQMAWKAGRTFVVCGLSEQENFFQADIKPHVLDRLSREGGRLLISFKPSASRAKHPANAGPMPPQGEVGALEAPAGEAAASGEDPSDAPVCPAESMWVTELGLNLQTAPFDPAADQMAVRVSPVSDPLPEQLPWRGSLYFEIKDPAWQTIYTWQGHPVIAVRTWGSGSVVMIGDSYLFSNEALRRDRQPELLAWLLRSPEGVIIDEFHHGLADRPGIAGLMRKYRLHGLAAGVMVLIVLFIWRRAAVFAPQPANASAQEGGADRPVEGWVGLMRQHIGSHDLLRVCYQAWHSSEAAVREPQTRLAEAGKLIEASAADPQSYPPLIVYRQICQIFKKGNRS